MDEKQKELLETLFSLLDDVDRDQLLEEGYRQAVEEEKKGTATQEEMTALMIANVEDDEETGADHVKYCLKRLTK